MSSGKSVLELKREEGLVMASGCPGGWVIVWAWVRFPAGVDDWVE